MTSIQHIPEVTLVKEEKKEVGVVSPSVYHAYWSSVGYILAPSIFLALLLMQGQHYWVMYIIMHASICKYSGTPL